MNEKLSREKMLWQQIEALRHQMIQKANDVDGNLRHEEVLHISQQLNTLLVEYQKILNHKNEH